MPLFIINSSSTQRAFFEFADKLLALSEFVISVKCWIFANSQKRRNKKSYVVVVTIERGRRVWQPIRGLYPGHLITLSQSETRISEHWAGRGRRVWQECDVLGSVLRATCDMWHVTGAWLHINDVFRVLTWCTWDNSRASQLVTEHTFMARPRLQQICMNNLEVFLFSFVRVSVKYIC